MKLQVYSGNLGASDAFEDVLQDNAAAGIFGAGQDKYGGDGVYVREELPERWMIDAEFEDYSRSGTMVRIEHCGRQHVIELSRWEWLAVARGRTLEGPACTRCQAPMPLPLERAHGRDALKADLREVWRHRLQRLRMFRESVSFPALLSLPLTGAFGMVLGMLVHARFFLGGYDEASSAAGVGGGASLLLWLVVWLILRWRARVHARREGALNALAGVTSDESAPHWLPAPPGFPTRPPRL